MTATAKDMRPTMVEARCFDRWMGLMASFGYFGDDTTTSIIEGLVAAYGEPHRHYHNLEHVDHCLSVLARHRYANFRIAEVALFYHDVVYDTANSNNEANSARRMLNDMGDILTYNQAHAVEYAIRATAWHTWPRVLGDDVVKLVLDCDIAILGAPEEDFAAYEAKIRVEYGHLSEANYRAGRASFLERLLGCRDHLFYTPSVREEYEERAQANVRDLIRRLK